MTYNLLVVDDEVHSRNTLCNCFPWEQIGFKVTGQADNGKDALAFIKKNTVHVLLCDIQMPVMNGIELVKLLHTWDKPPIIIFFSGYSEFEYARQAIQYGVRSYILKPIKYEDIVETFSKIKEDLDKEYLVESTESLNQDSFIQDVQNYVNSNIENANLSELSKRLYLNASYISHLYKQKTGQNFSDYVMEIRMQKAAELLKNTREKIYAIGIHVGYSNPKNFSRSFHSFYGKTPAEFRNDHTHLIRENKNEEV